MGKRWLLIGLSCLAAAGVLWLTLWLGPTATHEPASDAPAAPDAGPPGAAGEPEATAGAERRDRADRAGEAGEPGEPDAADDLAPVFDPDRVISRDQLTDRQFFDDVGGGYTLIEGDRRILMTWHRLTPRPQGVSDVVEPDTWVFLGPRRVLRITAEEGTLVAPRNEPREGRLVGDVVLTLYDARDHEHIDLDSLRDVRFRVHLDEAEFDLELGHVESDTDVELVGRRVAFRGRGLALTYNELRNRIERLQVDEGESLRFRRDLEAPRDGNGPRAAIHPPRPRVRLASVGDPTIHFADDADVENASPPDDINEPVQFYRATFHDAVRVTSGEGAMDMAGDELEAIFSFEADPGGGEASSGGPRHAAARSAPRAPVHPTSARGDDTVTPAESAGASDESTLFTPRSDDVVLRWDGPLVMVPTDAPPSDFAGPEDVLLTLSGAPARARTGDDEAIAARTLDYLTSIGRLRAERGDADPVKLSGPRLGTLTGERLEIDQSRGAGHLLGPGALYAPINADAAHADHADEPEALRLEFTDRLNLTFYLDETPTDTDTDADTDNETDTDADTDPPRAAGPPRLRGLRTATFHGEVTATHPEFDLRTRQLDAALADPDADDHDGRGTLRRLDALGDVMLTAHPAGQPPLDLEADALTIDVVGDARPRRIVGRGDVHTRQPDQRLWADVLELEFAEAARADGDDDGTDRAELKRMIATGDVRIELDEPATQLFGRRVVAEVARDHIELFGREAPDDWVNGDAGDTALARIVSEDAVLAGEHIVMRQREQAVSVDGHGWFDARLDDEESADDLRVTWARAMHYDDAVGHARFLGDVRADTRDAESRAWLTTDDLQLHLASAGATDDADVATDADEPAVGNATHGGAPGVAGQRRIRSATAQGESRFAAEQFEPDGQLRTKLRLEGPLISFDGEDERVQVVGAGRMFIDDRRPPRDGGADEGVDERADADGSPAAVSFTGRGETLFLWQRQMTLDGAADEMVMERTVQMLHQPAGEQDLMQLDAQRLLARFAEGDSESGVEVETEVGPEPDGARGEHAGAAGGFAGFGGGGGTDPVVELIRAGGAVRVVHGPRTVTSDHLQYTRADQRVRLWAEPGTGRSVRAHHADQPTGLSAEQMIWELERDRFEATDVGPGIVPLPE